ncbi:lipopolysaccharide biosynthesis protein [Thalassolituus sp.]|uniref:lipopolysaccharide biosynthesis protein n=2 Tax=Thalassolituus sp. TaxID=2030822 RepID=UPI0035163FFD
MKAIYAMGMKVGSAALSYLFLFSLSNTLDIGSLGLFLFAYTVFTVLVQVSKSGVDLVLIKAVTSRPSLSDVKGIFASNILLILSVSAVCSAMFFGASSYGVFDVVDSNEKNLGFSLVLIAVVIISVIQVFGALFQSRYKVVAQYWAMNVGLMAFLSAGLGAFILLEEPLGFLEICILFLACSLLVMISVLVVFYRQFGKELAAESTSMEQEKNSVFQTFKNNSPYIAAALLTIFLQWMPNLLGGVFMTEEELGGLGVSLRLSIASNFPFLAFAALAAPAMARYLHADNVEGLRSSYLTYHAVSVSFASAVLIFFTVFSEFMLGMFGVHGYEDLLVLCTLSWWVRVAVGPVGTILMLSGNYRMAISSLLVSVVICSSVFVFGYPSLGVNAAGWALLAGSVQLSLFNAIQAYRISGALYASPVYFYFGISSLFRKLLMKKYG